MDLMRRSDRRSMLPVLCLAAFGALTLDAQDRGGGGRDGGRDGEERRERRRRRDRQDKSAAVTRKFDLDSWGRLGRRVRGNEGFFEVSYSRIDEKGKRRKTKAFLYIPEEARVLRDARLAIEKIAEGDELLVFGKVSDVNVPSRGGGRARA